VPRRGCSLKADEKGLPAAVRSCYSTALLQCSTAQYSKVQWSNSPHRTALSCYSTVCAEGVLLEVLEVALRGGNRQRAPLYPRARPHPPPAQWTRGSCWRQKE